MAKVMKLKASEIEKAAETLSKSFKNDALMLWVFDSAEKYKKYSKSVIRTWVKFCFLYGAVYRTEDFSAVAILKGPNANDVSFWTLLRSGMLWNMWFLGKSAMKRVLLFDELSMQHTQKHMGEKKYWYLWMLATLPHCQKQGCATALLKEIDLLLQDSSCYLEATSQASVQLYNKHHYKQLDSWTLPESRIKVVCMEKKPSGILL